jgi:hypothetical protein
MFNNILKSAIFPNSWCEGLITPIHNQAIAVTPTTVEEYVSQVDLENSVFNFKCKINELLNIKKPNPFISNTFYAW